MRKLIHLLFILLCLAPEVVSAKTSSRKGTSRKNAAVLEYTQNPHVAPEIWEELKPYFLPPNHPVKRRLDKIFKGTRVIATLEAIKEAGFLNPVPQRWSKTIVTGHPHLPGYMVKMFSDEQAPDSHLVDHKAFLRRILGAMATRAYIKEHKLDHWFKAPKKWIYPLPADPGPLPGALDRQNFILIAEDMDIYHGSSNYKRWHREVKDDRLRALYNICQTLGLKESILAFNCPFCKDGKQAFLDTEYHHDWPIYYQRMMRWLSSDMQSYFWDAINAETCKKAN